MSFKKQFFSLFTVCTLALGTLAGCGGDNSNVPSTELLSSSPLGSMSVTASIGGSASSNSSDTGDSNKAGLDGFTITGADYVMIYNPLIYSEEETFDASGKTTGDMASQINTDLNRAGGLDELEFPTLFSQPNSLPVQLDEGTEIQKAGGLDPVYSVGDKHEFYIYDSTTTYRIKETLDCIYEGENCYIWTLNNAIAVSDAQSLANEFDTKIFDADVNAFGTGRFLQNGGKVNIFFYPLANERLLGFFSPADIYATGELPDYQVETFGCNLDHAIITINSIAYALDPEGCGATLAHEYQHQICASDTFEPTYHSDIDTWLNESMSAYAEELVYPNSKYKGGYQECLYVSDNFRCGQSLYNFENANDPYIGCYGAVFLFEEYLRNNGGADVFSKVHNIWRSGADTEATALASAVTPEFYDTINNSVTYPASISQAFASPEEEWLSKLTLQYFIDTNNTSKYGLSGIDTQDVLNVACYAEINAASIEGGGRILVSPVGGSYTIPSDADAGLIYAAFNSDGECLGIYSEDGESIVGGSGGTSSQPTSGGNDFASNNSTSAAILTLGTKDANAVGVADGIADGVLGSGASKTYTDCGTAKDIASAIIAEVDNGSGMILVYLSDTSCTASGLSLAVEYANGSGVPVILINSSVPENGYPWLISYNYSGAASTISELSAYGYDELYNFGHDVISPYVSNAITSGECSVLSHN